MTYEHPAAFTRHTPLAFKQVLCRRYPPRGRSALGLSIRDESANMTGDDGCILANAEEE